MPKINDIERWRCEIALAQKVRDDEFGKFTHEEKTLAGENIDYYERGFSDRLLSGEDVVTTVNIVDALVSIIVPSLYYKNPRTMCTPRKIESQDTAPLAAKTIDHYRKILEVNETNQKVIWDAYLLNLGVTKVGYVTRFGKDIKDEDKKPKSMVDKGLEAIGLKKKEEKEVILPEIDQRIIAENPFVEYISPFDWLRDPTSTSINDAMWVCQTVRKTVKDMKSNKKYKNTDRLKGSELDIPTVNFTKVSETEIEAFKTILLHEIHYRNDGKFYILVLSDDGEEWEEHYHEESIYELNEWQFDELKFKNHGHYSYERSDITKIKALQDRITSTIDAILEQVDKFVPMLGYSLGDVTENGLKALKSGLVGALVECNKNPGDVFKELNFTQLKADLQSLIDQLIGLITIQTGMTRAQLTGLSNSGSATEATIEQGGQNIRLSDMQAKVAAFVNRQSYKLWKVITQFVDLEELQLINGVKGINQETGLPQYDWLTINPEQRAKMINGEYDFDIEVGSTQKVDLAVVRKAFENLFNILARTEVISIIQQQGQKVGLGEILKKYFDLFPELGIDSGKIIQNITQGTQGLLPPEMMMPGKGGMTPGSQHNQMASQRAQPAPTMPNQLGASL